MRARLRAGLLVALTTGSGASFAQSNGSDWRLADRDLLDRVVRESEVAEALPQPGVWVYAQDIVESAWLWLLERVKRWELPAEWQRWLRIGAEVAVEAASLLLFLLLMRHLLSLLSLLRKTRGEARERVAVVLQGEAAAEVRRVDRDRFRHELDERLRSADVRGALEALWWWLASSLAGALVDPSWTNRELLARAGRLDLLGLTRALDRMRYGTIPPSVDEIRSFFGRLEKEIA